MGDHTEISKITLTTRVDAMAAEALHAEILDLRSNAGGLVIDASEVSLIDTPAIEIIISAAQDQVVRHESFHLKDPSDAFNDAVAQMGLAQEFEKWSSSNG
jgi:anti-anti-sigma regulatory factor